MEAVEEVVSWAQFALSFIQTWGGTALGIRIRTTGIDNAQAIIDAAASSGRREANEIQHAFKEASTPSKGLMNRSY